MSEKSAWRKVRFLRRDSGVPAFGMLLAFFLSPCPAKLAAQVFDPTSGEIVVPASAQVVEKAKEPAPQPQGMPAVMIIEEEPGRARHVDSEEQETHPGRKGRSTRSEEHSEETANPAHESDLWGFTMLHVLAIAGGLLVGLGLNFLALFWLMRSVGSKLTPQVHLEVVNSAGGGSFPTAPLFSSGLSLNAPSTSLFPTEEAPLYKPDPLQTEQALLKELFQQNMQMRQDMGPLETNADEPTPPEIIENSASAEEHLEPAEGQEELLSCGSE